MSDKFKYRDMTEKISSWKKKSVQSGNLCKSVIQTITQGHDGHLEVETEEGMGTRFIVKLPIV